MGNNVTFQIWKLISLKSNLRNILLTIFGIFIFVVIFFTYDTSCGVEHFMILNEININEKSFDPEFCESLLEKIDFFNDHCSPTIEILDCG